MVKRALLNIVLIVSLLLPAGNLLAAKPRPMQAADVAIAKLGEELSRPAATVPKANAPAAKGNVAGKDAGDAAATLPTSTAPSSTGATAPMIEGALRLPDE